jgi:hypothetical protein
VSFQIQRKPTYRKNTIATISITSNDGKLHSASAVLEVSATNLEYNQPAWRIDQARKGGGTASIGGVITDAHRQPVRCGWGRTDRRLW